jgi:ribonuclease PH
MEVGVAPHATGSVLVSIGNTKVICAVTVQSEVPRWMKAQKVPGGWLTGEYSLLPYATDSRTPREATTGKLGGRTQEIQRLIGRTLRSAVDLKALGTRTVWVDCDVLQADGGTRTAAITGGWVALRLAINRLLAEGGLSKDPIQEDVAAISVGMVDGVPCLDLCYAEDSSATVDMNVVMTASGRYIELQGSAERGPFTPEELQSMLTLARAGIENLIGVQQAALAPV